MSVSDLENLIKVVASRHAIQSPRAFGEIVARFQNMAYGCAYAILGDHHQAEDAAQDAFLLAWQDIGSLKEPQAFAGWLRRLVATSCNRVSRRSTRRTVTLDAASELSGMDDPENKVATRELSENATEWVRTLPEHQRVVLALRFAGGRSHREIADFLEITEGAVRKRLHDALKTIKGSMTKMAKEDLEQNLPSRDSRFAQRVRDAIHAAASGDVTKVAQVIAEEPQVIRASGAHPYWGGRPQALHVAVEKGDLNVIRLLLEHGADPNGFAASYGGWTPIVLAARKKRADIVQLLIERGAKPDLFLDLMMGDEKSALDRLRTDPNAVHAIGPNQSTPIYWARSFAIAKALLDAGANMDWRDVYDQTPLEAIAGRGAKGREIYDLLLNRGSPPPDAWVAAAVGDASRLAEMIDADANIVHATKDKGVRAGETPLHASAGRGNVEIARMLLDRGADVNARAAGGETPLHVAAASGELEAARLLIERGADRTIHDRRHDSPPAGWARWQATALGKTQCIPVAEFLESL